MLHAVLLASVDLWKKLFKKLTVQHHHFQTGLHGVAEIEFPWNLVQKYLRI